jgi:phage major head subunit gpT-like protein
MMAKTTNAPALPARLDLKATTTVSFEAAKGDAAPTLPRFRMVANTGNPMLVAGWKFPVVVDFAGLNIPTQNRPIRKDHDEAQGVGHTDMVGVEDGEIVAAGVVSRDTEAAREFVISGKNGFPWQASIGASVDKVEFIKEGDKVVVNGKTFDGPLNVARATTLGEISVVDLGADDNTSTRIAASVPSSTRKGADSMDFEKWLEAKGIDPAAIEDSVRATHRAYYDAEQAKPKPETKPTQTLEDITAARRKEDERVAEITRIAGAAMDRRPPLLDEFERMARSAIESKATVEKFELEVAKVLANLHPGTFIRKGEIRSGAKVIEAALCLGGRLEEPEKHFDQQTLNAASDRFRHGLGLQELLLMSAHENGYTGQSARDLEGVLKAAFGTNIKASGFSTLSLPGILSNVANKFLAAGFNAVESGWREISGIRPVNDFKSITSYALTGGMIYEKVGPDGELKHATVGELSYTNRAETYGRMFSITRQNLINDDIGALSQIPRKLGRGAALALNLVFWTEFLNNSAFFAAGNNNVSTGGGSALASAGLKAALSIFRKQTDPDGLPLAITPRILLVPPELEITADELMTSTTVNTGGAATGAQIPNRNVWASKFRVVQSSYLSNSAITGFSATAYYLLADPADMPVIEVAFLNGKETPTVESADADFNVLGIQFRGFLDFGVSKQEFRAGVRSAGA